MQIGQIVYNLQDYLIYNDYISTNKDNLNTTIKSSNTDYNEKKINIYENLIPLYGTKFTKLGIQAPPKTQFEVDLDKIIMVGQTGIYELDNSLSISYLKFVRPSNGDLYNVIIDFIYE